MLGPPHMRSRAARGSPRWLACSPIASANEPCWFYSLRRVGTAHTPPRLPRQGAAARKRTFGEPARMSGSCQNARSRAATSEVQFRRASTRPWRCGQQKMVHQNAAHAVICKSAAAAAAAAGDLSRIERGPVREFPSAKSSESGFLSSRKRSNIVPRATATGLP